MKYDFIIVGGGASGISAAITAKLMGKKVLILEKNAALGGNGIFPDGIFGAGSRLQRRLLIDADPEAIFKQAMVHSHWRSNARLVRALIDRSGETIDWLESMGVNFTRIIHHMPNQTPEVFHMTGPDRTGKTVTAALKARCEELEVEVITKARCTEIIMDNGAVAGVRAEIGGEISDFYADRVLICTGGFAGNKELMQKMLPNVALEGYMYNKGIPMAGDGLLMAEKAGAGIGHDIIIEGAAPYFQGRREINSLVRNRGCIWVNALGERFADERVNGSFIFAQNAIISQPGGHCYVIFDSSAVEDAKASLPFVMADPEVTDNGMGQLDQAIETELERGKLFRRDTLHELEAALGIDEGALCAAVEEYNGFCRDKLDRHFGKSRSHLVPIENGPFYAADCGSDIYTTHGGIMVNHRFEVVSAEGRPIPGLYAAGIDISGVDTGGYSVDMCGHAFGFAITGGRLAAESAMQGR